MDFQGSWQPLEVRTGWTRGQLCLRAPAPAMARRQHCPAPHLQMGQPSGRGPMGSSEPRAGGAEVLGEQYAGARVLPRNLPKSLVCFPRTTRPGPRTQAEE